jgi:hypothetical protein
MQELKFINAKGAEIRFSLDLPYIFWKIAGLNLPPSTTVSTQAPNQNGSTLRNVLLEPRVITLTGHVYGALGKRAMYEKRRELNNVCNPLFGLGTLIYTNDFGSWKIEALCRANNYLDKIREVQTLAATFEAPTPFWEDLNQTGIYFAYVEGGLKFPVKLPNMFGMLGYRVIVDNYGDWDAPIELFMEGGAVNPIITNKTTGAFIKLTRDLDSSMELYINSDPEKLEVSIITIDPETNQKVKQNAYGYITHDSTIQFYMSPGKNEIVFDSDDENKAVKIKIYFRRRYVGL